jgi:pimeloyl-ACP methyl ester carboxylesterase
MDVRGYGRSTRPPEMAGPTADGTPVVRSPEAVRDIAAVVDDTRRRTGASRVAVVGWAVGGSWAAEYAAAHPDAVSDLVLFNSMTGFATQPRYGVGSANSDPADPNVYRRDAGAYGLATPEAMLSTWDSSIPAQDKSEWRDPAVAEAYVRTALDSDETSGTRQPESMRAPNGAQLDTFHLASGRPTFDPTSIRSRVLIVRSELDFWSSPEDPDGLRQRLTGAQEARVVTIAGATHYLHLDRPEYGAERFRAELDTFLNRGA